jgi:hypothetical protein
VGRAGLEGLLDVVSTRASKDNNVEERVGTESVCAVDRDAGSFTGSVKTRNNLVVSILRLEILSGDPILK